VCVYIRHHKFMVNVRGLEILSLISTVESLFRNVRSCFSYQLENTISYQLENTK